MAVLQNDFVDVFETCIVAPVLPRAQLPSLPRLRPRISINGNDHVIAIDRLAAVDRRSIGDVVGDAQSVRDEITRALDLIFTGF